MTAISKLVFDEVFRNKPCYEMFHPWNRSCSLAFLDLFSTCVKGSSQLVLLVYVGQLVLKRQKLKKLQDYISLGDFVIKAGVLSVLTAVLTIQLNCLVRRLCQGRILYYNVIYLIPFLSGAFIGVVPSSKQDLIVSYFLTMACEGMFRSHIITRLANKPIVIKLILTIFFMISNTFLMYRVQAKCKSKYDSEWFYTPLELREEISFKEANQGLCFSQDRNFTQIIKTSLKYSSIGLLTSVLKITLFNLKDIFSSDFVRKILHWTNFRLAAFIGMYVGGFEGIRYYMYKRTGKDSARNFAISGLVAGISFVLNPNVTILSAMLVVIIKIFGKYLKSNYPLPELPYSELVFMAAYTYLMKLRVLDKPNVPPFFITMLDIITKKKTDIIIENFRNKAEQIMKII